MRSLSCGLNAPLGGMVPAWTLTLALSSLLLAVAFAKVSKLTPTVAPFRAAPVSVEL